jgi:hypothetical protein
MKNDKSEYYNYLAEKDRDLYFRYLAEKLEEYGLIVQEGLFDFEDGDICGLLENEYFGICLVPSHAFKPEIIQMRVWLQDQRDKFALAEKFTDFFGAPPIYSYYAAAEPDKTYYIWNRYPKMIDYEEDDGEDKKYFFTNFRVPPTDLLDLTVDNVFALQSLLMRFKLPLANLKKVWEPGNSLLSFHGELSTGDETFWLQALDSDNSRKSSDNLRLYFEDGRGDRYLQSFSLLFGRDPFIAYQRVGQTGHFYEWSRYVDDKTIEPFLTDKTVYNRRSWREIEAGLKENPTK